MALLKTAPLLATILASVFALSFAIFSAGFGIDITDESFYLQSLLEPGDVKVGVTLWHQVLAPLFWATGPDLQTFRIVGILVLAGTTVFLGYRFERALGHRPDHSHWMRATCIVATLILGSLYYYRLGLLTPSYNWLSLVAAMLTVGAAWRLVATQGRKTRRHLFLCILIGFGCALAMLARPTGGLCLTAVTATWVAASIRSRDVWVYACWCAVTAAMLIGLHVATTHWYFDLDFLSFFQNGREVYIGLEAGHSGQKFLTENPLKLAKFAIAIFGSALVLAVFLLAFIDATLLLATNLLRVRLPLISTLRSRWSEWATAFLALAALFAFLVRSPEGQADFVKSLGQLSGFLTGGYVYLAIRDKRAARHSGLTRRQTVMQPIVFGAFCLLVSFSVSFGTNGSIVEHMGQSTVFAVLFILYLVVTSERLFAQKHGLSLVSVVIAIAVISDGKSGFTQPYRSPQDIFTMNDQVEIGRIGSILTDDATARYVEDLHVAGQLHGFSPGMSLIDLTGGTPAAAVVLQAHAPAMPWIVGGYGGSDEVARFLLRQMSDQDTGTAWILTTPDGPRRISVDVLDAIGRTLEEDYEMVSTLTTGHRSETQILWRPRAP